MMTLAVLSVLAAVAGIYRILEESENPLLTNYPDVSLPNFVGMTEMQARQEGDFQFEVEYVYNDEFEKDTIIAQKPTAPRTVKGNSLVMIKVSKGVMTSEMPDLVDYNRAEAQAILSELGVNLYIKTEEHNDIPYGTVIATEPEAGVTVSSGEVVTLYVAVEEVQRTRFVPHVVGMQVEEAKRLISNTGLRSKVVLTANEQEPGTVIWQNHGPGVELAVGSQVELHVSAGPQ